MPLLPYRGILPAVADDATIDPAAFVIGNAQIGPGVSVGRRTVLRADQDAIVVGRGTRFGQRATVHVDPGTPATIGQDVLIEDDAIVHACTLGDAVRVGQDATILTGSSVGAGSIVEAGALVPEGKAYPDRALIAGVPGRVVRETTDDEVAETRRRARGRSPADK